MRKNKQKVELIDSLKSLIVSYDVQIEQEEDHITALKKEKYMLEKRLYNEED